MSDRRPLGPRRRAPPQERHLAREVAAFIGTARRMGMANDALLLAIDRAWPQLRARTLIAAHFLELEGRRQGRVQ